MKRKLLPFASLFIALVPLIQGQDDGFNCEEHNLFIDRLGAIPGVPTLPDNQETKVLATQNFSGFSKYGIDSVRLTIRFDPDSGTDSEGKPLATGNLRVAATIHAHEKTSDLEIRKREGWKKELHDEYTKLFMVLRGWLIPADPSDPDSGRPNIRLQQPEAGVPIFLVTFTGIAAAGGWGNVDSENAVVLDLRAGTLSISAAVGCIKDDFAGHGPGGGWADCSWDRLHQDYDCKSSEGEFFLISGKQIFGHTKSNRRK